VTIKNARVLTTLDDWLLSGHDLFSYWQPAREFDTSLGRK